jgi:hypothetical protein
MDSSGVGKNRRGGPWRVVQYPKSLLPVPTGVLEHQFHVRRQAHGELIWSIRIVGSQTTPVPQQAME